MTPLALEIIEELKQDLSYHGWIMQGLRNEYGGDDMSLRPHLIELLRELLSSGRVEIGETCLDKPNYLAFVAWKGTVQDRISRAMREVDQATRVDKDFAYWICLKENLDYYEE